MLFPPFFQWWGLKKNNCFYLFIYSQNGTFVSITFKMFHLVSFLIAVHLYLHFLAKILFFLFVCFFFYLFFFVTVIALLLFRHCHTILVGYYGFKLDIPVSAFPFVIHLSILHIRFTDDNLWKRQWILTKLGMCIDTVEIWFIIANGHITSIYNRVIWSSHIGIFISGL